MYAGAYIRRLGFLCFEQVFVGAVLVAGRPVKEERVPQAAPPQDREEIQRIFECFA